MQVQTVGLELTEAERVIGGRLLKLVPEIDRVEGYAGAHAIPLSRLAVELGKRAGLHGSDLTSLKFAALSHDVGERALKREYLLRAGRLTSEERLDLVRHSILGEQAAATFGLSRAAQLFIRWHHEWWNGYGYPDALIGDAIPLGARILRVADTWGALISDRPHRPRHDQETAEAILADQAGFECDPQVVALLLDLLREKKAAEEAEARRLARFSFSSDWLPVHEVWDTPLSLVPPPADEHVQEPQTSTSVFVASAKRNRRWVGFELSVLRRLKFASIATPFSGRPDLEWFLKGWGKQVFTNDICQWSWWMSRALIENSREALDVDDVTMVLEDASLPRYEINNPALWRLMPEADASWFDNVWLNIQKLGSERLRALAYLHALNVGDYARSFTPETMHLRRPLSEAFTSLWRSQRPIIDNEQINVSANGDAHDFIRGVRADCMFVRLPGPEGLLAHRGGPAEWRETWVRGTDSAWETLAAGRVGRLGDQVASKDHYLELAADFFERARHIPRWAIAHSDDGFLSASELGELVKPFRRRVEVTYTKDFSGVIGGSHAYIIIAA
ncbi:MAG: HD domain-containing phosphohydrolase [Acidobacteriota bacterium]